jgi:hypothetical protein
MAQWLQTHLQSGSKDKKKATLGGLVKRTMLSTGSGILGKVMGTEPSGMSR